MEVIEITDEASELVEENHNLIYSLLHKCHLNIEEWYDIAAIGLCKAANYMREGLDG
mgnify:CR=1 FL=1|jgi:hypothetical protein